jgi:hypothetical protein
MTTETKSINDANRMKSNANHLAVMLGAVLAVSGLLAATTSARADGGDCKDSPIFPPDSHPYGASYGEWLARYWQWTFAFPVDATPDYLGFGAYGTAPWSANQSGKVWFLPLSFGSATLTGTVPEDTALCTATWTTEWDNTACPTYTDYSVEQLIGFLETEWSQVTETSVTIDGVTVRGLGNPQTTPYFVITPPFAYTLASHDNVLANAWGEPCIPDGTTVCPAVAAGQCFIIRPLPVGQHTIQFHVVGGTSYAITNEITVVPRCDK